MTKRDARWLTNLFCMFVLASFLCIATLAGLAPVVSAAEERPANFIFLIDVSGSMLSKSTMVTGADGQQITLFEALRQALKQIAQDERLIGSKSRTCFITFGTKITEMSDWPTKLETAADRQQLLDKISSPDSLAADKHGDTYMGGALAMALDRANQLYSQSDPCATTFIVMLTDGWDEPPAGASIKVTDAAKNLSSRVKQIQSKMAGVKTWPVLVIGLQRLPDRKAGTTTAKELADLLGGGFIDVTKQAGGTVSQKIFLALKQTVESLKGEIRLAAASSNPGMKEGVIDFGTTGGDGKAQGSISVDLRSCYPEDISGVNDVSTSVSKDKMKGFIAQVHAPSGEAIQFVSAIPAGAISVQLAEGGGIVVAPQVGENGERKSVFQKIDLSLQAHSNCPAGRFVGCIKLESSAKVPELVPYMVSVPGRVVAEEELLKVRVKKPGIIWTEATETTLEDAIKQLPGSHANSAYNVEITPESAIMRSPGAKSKNGTVEARIDVKNINDGKPVNVTLDTTKSDRQPIKLDVFIPADTQPGRYEGKLGVKITGNTDIVAPSEVPFEIIVEPSVWEQVAPVAVPVFIIFCLITGFGFFLWVTNLKRN
jgi:hypothetical protein